jgi:hypothetical protein
LIEQYERWIEQTKDASQIKNIIECLYHTTLMMKEEGKGKEIHEKIYYELKKFVEKIKLDGAEHPTQIFDQMTRLENELDRDEELKKELKNIIPAQELFDFIRKQKSDI